VLALVALAALAGLVYLFSQNVNLPSRDGKSEPVAQAPGTPAANPNNEASPAPTAVAPAPAAGKKDSTSPKTSDPPAGSDIDVADLPAPPHKAPTQDPVVPVTPKAPEPAPKPKAPVIDVPAPAAPTQPVAAGVDPERIDQAIERGVKYLKATQTADGSWPGVGEAVHVVGRAALGALALLECNQPANDPNVQRAVKLVRSTAPTIDSTYEASLAILLLDRLGDPQDRNTIRTLALNLAAGQNLQGGWGYRWGRLNQEEQNAVDSFLRTHWPWSRARPRPPELGSRPIIPGKQITEGAPRPTDVPPKEDTQTKKPAPKKTDMPFIDLRNLPENELRWNTFLNSTDAQVGDNSNTQFALLAMWVARRHDVATECPILNGYARFRRLQYPDGSFGYQGFGSEPTKAMTCAGLLGLAMGRGVVPALPGAKVKQEDPTIAAGLRALGSHIGTASTDPTAQPPMENLYFLWSVERIGVLFDIKTIAKKDWYAWGSQILVNNQRGNGSWLGQQYVDYTVFSDTCFALLFLKRANLAPDLTETLRLQMVIRP
jgi:hypothetical protein